MIAVLLLTLPLDPWSLFRIDDPSWPGAEATSATGAVVLEPPPPGTPYSLEHVPMPDVWVAEEALAAMNITPWHSEGGTGEGVRVAVFDIQWFASFDEAELGAFSTHDCWAHPSCEVAIDTDHPRFGFEEGVHGFACAEVVHDIAPDAELFLVRVNGRTGLENAVTWAIRNDIDVITLSMSFTTSSFHDGTGPVNRQVQRAAEAGIVFATSAGNYARGHWGGPWTDANGDGRLDMDGDDALTVRLSPGMGSIVVQWDQHQRCGLTDLDVLVTNSNGDIVGRSERDQITGADRCDPLERVAPNVQDTSWGQLSVILRRGVVTDLDVDVLALSTSIEDGRPEGSIADPASSRFAVAVAAVRAEGYLDNQVEPFSSRGDPTRNQDKPDIAAPDGVSTSAYGPASFFGTSAASPALAGAIAVWMSAHGVDAPEALDALEALAREGNPVWAAPDPELGAGKVRLGEPGAPSPGCTGRAGLWLVGLWPIALWGRRRRSPKRDIASVG